MIPILLLGENLEKLAHQLYSILSKKHGCTLCGEKNFVSENGPSSYLIVSTGRLRESHCEAAIAVLWNTPVQTQLSPKTVLVANAQNPDNVQFAAQNKLCTITYGRCQTDTLTLSSFTQDSAVVSLQRTITTLSGQKIEPVEIPVSLSAPWDASMILSIAAVLLLSDNGDLLENLMM